MTPYRISAAVRTASKQITVIIEGPGVEAGGLRLAILGAAEDCAIYYRRPRRMSNFSQTIKQGSVTVEQSAPR